MSLAEALKNEGLRLGHAFLETHTRSCFVTGLPLNFHDPMSTYRAARPTTHFCQMAQNADTRMQLGGSTPSSSTGVTYQGSTKEGDHKDCQWNQEPQHFCAQRDRVHVSMISDKSPLTTAIKNSKTSLQENIRIAASAAVLQMIHCRVCLARDNTMKKFPYTVSVEKLSSTR